MTNAAVQRVTVAGSFGLGNIGDEAVPLALSDLAQAQGLSISLDVVSRFAQVVLPGVISLGPHDAGRRQALCHHPLVLAGGGIVEPAAHAVLFRCRHLLRQVGLQQASLLGAAVEAGVRYPWLARWRVRRLLSRMRCLYLRDEWSWQALRQILPGRKLEVTGDCVLWMQAAGPLPPSVRGLGRFVAVSLAPRWSAEPAFPAWLARHLVSLAQRLQAAVVFVPCSTRFDDDRVEHRRVGVHMRHLNPAITTVLIEDDLDARQVATVLRAAELTVGMRLHACVIAYAQRCPFLALAYHPKLAAFTTTVGCSRCLLPRKPPPQQTRFAYGYSFADSGLLEVNLEAAALEAIANTQWHRLEDLRSRIRDGFLKTIGR